MIDFGQLETYHQLARTVLKDFLEEKSASSEKLGIRGGRVLKIYGLVILSLLSTLACKPKAIEDDPDKCRDVACSLRLAESMTISAKDGTGVGIEIQLDLKSGQGTYESVEKKTNGTLSTLSSKKNLSVAQREKIKRSLSEDLKQVPYTFTNCPDLAKGQVNSITSRFATKEVSIYGEVSTRSVCPEIAYVVTDASFASYFQDISEILKGQ